MLFTRDVANGIVDRFPLITAARTAKIGLGFGLGYGLIQDAMSLARGRRVGYVELFRGLVRKETETKAT